jgi:hypothetical protein
MHYYSNVPKFRLMSFFFFFGSAETIGVCLNHRDPKKGDREERERKRRISKEAELSNHSIVVM